MRSGLIAQKIGMTRVFTDAGEHVPVTVLKVDKCQVIAQRTQEKNGYSAVQLGVVQPVAEDLRAADLPAVTGLSTATLWRLERRGEFPGRRRVSPRCVGWLSSEVEEWLRSRPLARHAGPT